MQQFMVERQRREIDRQKEQYRKLVGVTRGNLSSQTRVHAAVLQMLSARSFEHLIDIVAHELSHKLGADVVGLCIESDGNTMPRSVKGTLFVLARSEEHTSELQSLMRISYAVFCLKKKNTNKQ